MKREAARGMLRLTLCATCLLLTCWLAQASEPGPISVGLSPLKLTREEIVSILGSEELYKGSEIAMWLAEKVLPEARAEIKATAEQAAADALKPVLAELAGQKARAEILVAQRDFLETKVRNSRWDMVAWGITGAMIGWSIRTLVSQIISLL
jgi:hypothetical protein